MEWSIIQKMPERFLGLAAVVAVFIASQGVLGVQEPAEPAPRPEGFPDLLTPLKDVRNKIETLNTKVKGLDEYRELVDTKIQQYLKQGFGSSGSAPHN